MIRSVPGLLAVALLLPTLTRADICDTCHGAPGGPERGRIHAGGVASCGICHTMHNSQDGVVVDPDGPNGNQWLLRDATPSDVCLSCHAHGISHTFGDNPLVPPPEVGAGNFVFLLEDNLNDGHNGANNPIPGEAAGHSIDAPSQGVGPDGTLTHGPGGSFPSAALGCTSCHDPHGNGNFRMLYGVGPVQSGIYQFSHAAPTGAGLSIYHGLETNNQHTAYASGFSDWCANCHGDFHANDARLIHPSGEMLGVEVAALYNGYNGTDDPFGGSQDDAYLALVPFEDPESDRERTQGPSASNRVICLSCHRAHASSAPDGGRWDFAVTFLVEDGVESGSHPITNPYGSVNQRSLCNKCHAKDEFDRPLDLGGTSGILE